ncbi:hypothetical protein NDL68_28090, partial [Neorhizobium galegae]|nr:hypothetical protein [Neorhizobium galegae]
MKLVWSAFALSDHDDIFTHIEADNPNAAITVDERIVTAARRRFNSLQEPTYVGRSQALAYLRVRPR